MLFEEVKCLTWKDRCNDMMKDLLTTSSERRENICYISVNNIGPFKKKKFAVYDITLIYLTWRAAPINLDLSF